MQGWLVGWNADTLTATVAIGMAEADNVTSLAGEAAPCAFSERGDANLVCLPRPESALLAVAADPGGAAVANPLLATNDGRRQLWGWRRTAPWHPSSESTTSRRAVSLRAPAGAQRLTPRSRTSTLS